MAHDTAPSVEARPEKDSGLRPLTLKQVLVVTGNTHTPTATVTIVVEGQHETKQRYGSGPIDALFKAIDEAVGHYAIGIELTAYSVRSRGKGAAATAYVKVCIEKNGKSFHGSYQHVDTLVASAYAYVDALRKVDF
jgi:2-isopropylmalate synthase